MKLKIKTSYSSTIDIYLVICLMLTLLNYVLCVETNTNDKYYLITFEFNSEIEEEIEEEFDITSENNNNKSISFIDKQMKDILKLMVYNKETYENKELIEQYTSLKEKRDGNNDSFESIIDLIYKNSSSLIDVLYKNEERGIYTIYALLSNELYLIIKELPYVIECAEDDKMEEFEPDIEEEYDEEEEDDDFITDDYYNTVNIKNETLWDNVSIYKNAFNHQSLLSQGKFESSLINKYDTNYYYPESAGKDVNIVVIDSGFMFDHEDFDTNNRIVRCEAICISTNCYSVYDDPVLSKYCTGNGEYPHHGTRVASVAAGKKYGIAKKANIFGISVDMSYSSIVTALKYVLINSDTIFPPSKTIVNISSGSYIYRVAYDNTLQDLTNKGYMIITSGGNNHIDSCVKQERSYLSKDKIKVVKDFHYPSGYDSTIGVGSINNIDKDKSLNNSSKLYSKASFSNYGNCIDFWAPGYVYAASPNDNEISVLNKPNYCNNELKNKNDIDCTSEEQIKKYLCFSIGNYFLNIKKTSVESKWSNGTSYSSPIVAGVGALIVSENKNIKFNQDLLKKKLKELSLKNIINFDETTQHSNNIFINNGKRITYSRDNIYPKNYCGERVGNSVCTDNQCCYSDGICGTSPDLCQVINGCQSEFGYCIGLQATVKETTTTTKVKQTTTTTVNTSSINITTTAVKNTTTIIKTTSKSANTTVAKTTPKSTTTIVKTTQRTSNKPTSTTSVKSTSTSLPLIYIITMYNQNYYVGEKKSSKPYDLRITRNKTKLYSNIKTSKVWGEIKNSSGLCLGSINENYCQKNGIDKSSLKQDYLVYLPCNDSNVLYFYQYAISTGDTIIKIGYKNGDPFKGYYEDSSHYRCNGKENCCFYLDNDSIIAANCDNYYSSNSEKKYYSYKIIS